MNLNKDTLESVCILIKDYLREGKSLEMFLADWNIPKKQWNKFLRKNKKVQETLDDGLIYYKAHWQRKLDKAMFKRGGNSALAKMAFQEALGWTQEAEKRQRANEKRPRFKLILDLGPDEEENNNAENK